MHRLYYSCKIIQYPWVSSLRIRMDGAHMLDMDHFHCMQKVQSQVQMQAEVSPCHFHIKCTWVAQLRIASLRFCRDVAGEERQHWPSWPNCLT